MNTNHLWIQSGLIIAFITFIPSAFAEDWSKYRAVERPTPQADNRYGGYGSSAGYGGSGGSYQNYPQNSRFPQTRPTPPYSTTRYPSLPYPNYPHPNIPQNPHPSFPQQRYPQQNGISIVLQQTLPSTTIYQSNQTVFVNGQNASIESTEYTLISDWRRYGLPAPQAGMHWIYQFGRYIQVPNDR